MFSGEPDQKTAAVNARFLGVPVQLYLQVLHSQLRMLHEAALSRATGAAKSGVPSMESWERRGFLDVSQPGSGTDSQNLQHSKALS